MNQNTAQQLVIDVTLELTAGGLQATLKQVRNALGEDITNDFRLFAHDQKLPLNNQQEIEHAAMRYVEQRKGLLP